MQGLADGYFVLPYTIGNYFATAKQPKPSASHPEFKKALEEAFSALTNKLLSIKGKRTRDFVPSRTRQIMWEKCGMARNEAGLKEALQAHSRVARRILEERQCHRRERRVEPESRIRRARGGLSWNLPNCFASTRCIADESCGGHFRAEFQTPDGEAQARRREFRLRRRLGISGRRTSRRFCTKNRSFTKKCT